MRSQYSASSRKCVVTITVTPCSTMALMCDQNSRRVSGSTPEVGSSRNSTAGSCITGAGQRQPLLEAQRQLAGILRRDRAQAERLDHAADRLPPPVARQAVDAGEEIEILPHAQIAVERKLLGHVAQPPPGGPAGPIQVEAGHPGAAGGRAQQAAHHLERGRLARAVGAEQAEDLAAPDAKRNIRRRR